MLHQRRAEGEPAHHRASPWFGWGSFILKWGELGDLGILGAQKQPRFEMWKVAASWSVTPSLSKKLKLLLHHRQAHPWLLIHSACEELIPALKQHLPAWYGRCRLRDKQPEHISEYTCNLENHGIIHPFVSCPSAEHAGMLEKLMHVMPEPGHKWVVPPGRCLLEIQAIGKVFLLSLWQTMKFDISLNTERGICYSDVRENVQD